MTAETPIEMLHLPRGLRTRFTGKLPEAEVGNPEQRERNFLSRALAAYSVHKLGGATIEEASSSVVDGGGDGGIDAIYHSHINNTLFIVQSKFINSGRGEPELGDVSKFKSGLENMLQGKFDAFKDNAPLKKLTPHLQHIFATGGLQVRAVLVYSGINLVSDDRRRLFEDLKRRFSPDSSYFDHITCSLTTIHDWLVDADVGPGVPKVSIVVQRPGVVSVPYETVYGYVSIKDIYDLYKKHGKLLISANIRAYIGRTEVNEHIFSTIKNEPEHLFYLNNGLTAFCERLEIHNLDRGNYESKRLVANQMSIVNGAQTIGSIAKYFSTNPSDNPNAFVFMKIISLERCTENLEFADRITRSTNFQNMIGTRDFVALTEQQDIIAQQLILSGVHYHFKQDCEVPTSDATNFTLEEATTACACLAQRPDCDYCARVLANRQSLWSMDEIYPPDQVNRSIYSQVFRPDRSARVIWRAVQIQRLVIKVMQENARASTGIRKAFFENARWLVLNVAFLKLRLEYGETLSLAAEEEVAITRFAIECAEALFETCESKGFITRQVGAPGGVDPYQQARHFRSVFSAASDCQILRNALLQKLA